MTIATIDRLIALLKYVDEQNIEPAGPSRNRDFHLVTECKELTRILTIEKKITKSRNRDAAEEMTRVWDEGGL